MNTSIFLFILLCPFVAAAQPENLVPNPSFEQYKTLPNDISQGRTCLVDWLIPNKIGAGDYYHEGCSTKRAGTHKNYFGKQKPHTGKAYVGLCITKKFREYIQVKLTSTLIANSDYKIEVYISCADKKGLSIIDEFNMLFSTQPFTVPNNEDLLIVPKVKFIGNFSSTKEWIQLSAIYRASGTENYITFGSFTYEENGIKHGQLNGISKYAHYYVDDVSLTLIDKPEQALQEIIKTEKKASDSLKNYSANQTYVFDKLLFESGKSTLLNTNYPELDELIHFLDLNPHLKIRITGHTDNVGNAMFNQELSYDRANAVKLYLITKGINENRIIIEGKGDTAPLLPNDTEEGRKTNRRVEISILP